MYIYLRTTILLVSFKIIFENKSDSTQGIFTKRMKITNEPQHYCILMFRFKLEQKNSLRTHEDKGVAHTYS